MCGFVGYAGPKPTISRQRLVDMGDSLTHRGPDDSGIWLETTERASVGLAHRRLSILDTRSIGRQPMESHSQRTTIAFNGEFYGYREARKDLQHDRGTTFQTETDTEVILALYETHGLDVLNHLDGMFAFAIWDRTRQRLLLARDRMGIKPLFYSLLSDGSLIFGSEIKALLASKKIDDQIDLQAHHDYLGLNYVPGSQTIFSNIRKLDPGQALSWSPDECRTWSYWTHPLQGNRLDGPPTNFQAASQEVLTTLQTAVQRRMVSDVPLGMFLSGGIDSTAILMAMSHATDAPVKAFTIRFEEDSYDESPHAQIAANAFGAQHLVETVRPDVKTFLEPLIETLDEPFADSSVIPLWYLCRLARQHVTVALGGDGGDEVFAGYRTHFAWRLAKVWRYLPTFVRERLVPALVARLPVSHSKVSLDLKIKAFVSAASHPAIDAHCYFKQFMSENARENLTDSNAPVGETVRLFREAVASMKDPHTLGAILRSDFALYLPDDILVKVDRISMAHSLEARVPFLDANLVESVAGYPDSYTLRGLKTKAVLKNALKGRVPNELLTRKKAGFNVPMAEWLVGPMQGLMLDVLSAESIGQLGLWKPTAVQTLIDEHIGRHRDHSRTIWALMCFVLFNQRFRGGRSAR